MIYQNQEYDNFILGLNVGTFFTRANMRREITEGSVQSLKIAIGPLQTTA